MRGTPPKIIPMPRPPDAFMFTRCLLLLADCCAKERALSALPICAMPRHYDAAMRDADDVVDGC